MGLTAAEAVGSRRLEDQGARDGRGARGLLRGEGVGQGQVALAVRVGKCPSAGHLPIPTKNLNY